jgi:hypothetical protein
VSFLKETHICTIRFVRTELFEAQRTLLVTAADLSAIAARRQLQGTDAWFVVIADSFNLDADTERSLIYGFPDDDTTRDYASRRMKDEEAVRAMSELRRTGANVPHAWRTKISYARMLRANAF